MGDTFYTLVTTLCRPAFWVSSQPVVLHADRIPPDCPLILASTHTSPYDVPALMRHTPRRLDFVSITEVFRNPLTAWFFSHMNAFPLERSRADPATVRIILDRLSRGRVVAMFPEGRIRTPDESVVHGTPFRPGVGRLARLANVPIIPVVVWGAGAYARFSSWLPFARTRYGVHFGNPIDVTDETDAERQLAAAYRELYAELSAAMSG